MFDALNIIGSGLTANKEWMEVTSNNIANINTTRTAEGGPYHRQTLTFNEINNFDDLFNKQIGGGVEVGKIMEDKSEQLVYNPQSPDANSDGYVRMPAINLAAEMTNMMAAQRAYESNVTSLNATKQVMEKTQEIGKV